jgi:hypothetical protein
VDLLVLDALRAHAGDPEVLKDRYARAMEAAGSVDAPAERDALKAQVRDIETRQARLVDAVEPALLPDHIVRRRQKAFGAEMKLVRSRLDATVDAAIIPSLPDLWAILTLAGGLETAGRDGQRELLECLATAVEIDPRGRDSHHRLAARRRDPVSSPAVPGRAGPTDRDLHGAGGGIAPKLLRPMTKTPVEMPAHAVLLAPRLRVLVIK